MASLGHALEMANAIEWQVKQHIHNAGGATTKLSAHEQSEANAARAKVYTTTIDAVVYCSRIDSRARQ